MRVRITLFVCALCVSACVDTLSPCLSTRSHILTKQRISGREMLIIGQQKQILAGEINKVIKLNFIISACRALRSGGVGVLEHVLHHLRVLHVVHEPQIHDSKH